MLNHDMTEKIRGMELVKAESKRRGFGKGRGGRGTMSCPVPGCTGQVTFAVSASNGHIRLACNAAGCMQWLE